MSETMPNIERSFRQLDHAITPSVVLHERLRSVFAEIEPVGGRKQSSNAGRNNRHLTPVIMRWLAVAAIVILSIISVFKFSPNHPASDSGAVISAPGNWEPFGLSIPPGFDLPVRSAAWPGNSADGVPGPAPASGEYRQIWSIAAGEYAEPSVLFGPNVYLMNFMSEFSNRGMLRAYAITTGDQLWEIPVASLSSLIATPFGVVAIVNDPADATRVRVAMFNHLTGETIWTSDQMYKRNTDMYVQITGDVLLLSTGSGTVNGISLADGLEIWQFSVQSSAGVSCSPCKMQLGIADGFVFVLNSITGVLSQIDPEDGREIWNVDTKETLSQIAPTMTSLRGMGVTATDSGPLILYSLFTTGQPATILIQFSRTDGAEIWDKSFGNTSYSQFAYADRIILVINDNVEIIDAATGASLPIDAVSSSSISGQMVYLSEAGAIMTSTQENLDPATLAVRDTISVGACAIIYPINPDGSLLCYAQSSRMIAYYTPVHP